MVRPVTSIIRKRMVDILYLRPNLTGYDLFKIYIAIFGKVTLRSMYYHLKKGLSIDEFEIAEIKDEMGDYSWGDKTRKIYYKLGNCALPEFNDDIKKYLDSIK